MHHPGSRNLAMPRSPCVRSAKMSSGRPPTKSTGVPLNSGPMPITTRNGGAGDDEPHGKEAVSFDRGEIQGCCSGDVRNLRLAPEDSSCAKRPLSEGQAGIYRGWRYELEDGASPQAHGAWG